MNSSDAENQFAVLAESLPQLVWSVRPDGSCDYFNRRWHEVTGLTPEQSAGAGWHQAVHPHDLPNVQARWNRSVETGEPFECEHRIRNAAGVYERVLSRAAPCRDASGRITRWLGTSTPIDAQDKTDEAVRILEEQQLLARELNHRVKNLFAIANGMVSMTARTAKDPKEMATALRGRLSALSRTYELVQPVAGAGQIKGPELGLAQLIEAVLEPYRQQDETRIVIEGPSVPVGSGTTTSLALVLHELATNAAKYGSLSSPEGRLVIRWTLQDNSADLRWIETGGPPIAKPPTFEGFGTQLSQRSIAGQLGGVLDQEWRPEGLQVHMTLPLDRLAG